MGVGVHSGLPVNLTIGPASVDAGFIFVRTGLDSCDREVQATAEHRAFDDRQFNEMLALARKGVDALIAKQQAVLSTLTLRQ